jgi:hypothetical protein
MITIYTTQDIINKDRKLYIFLCKKNILNQFLLGLNIIHNRSQQHTYWARPILKPYDSFNMFNWMDYQKKTGDETNFAEYYRIFKKEYDSLKENLTLIKIL